MSRRSWYQTHSSIKKAAALIVQSRRWLYGRVKGLLYDGFFLLPSSGRLLLIVLYNNSFSTKVMLFKISIQIISRILTHSKSHIDPTNFKTDIISII